MDDTQAQELDALRGEVTRMAGIWRRAAKKEADRREELSDLMKRAHAAGLAVRELQRLAEIKHYNTAAQFVGASQGRPRKAAG
jgi:hypothetical protein